MKKRKKIKLLDKIYRHLYNDYIVLRTYNSPASTTVASAIHDVLLLRYKEQLT